MRPRGLFLCLSLPVVLALGHAAAGCVFRSADDCELTLGFGCQTSTQSSSSSGGGGGGGATTTATTSSSSSGGGMGGGPMCVDPSLCPDPPEGPCKALATKVCDEGKCAVQYDTTTALPSQQYGSCKKKQCDATGAVVDAPDDGNVYDDGNPCTQESCSDGVPSQIDAPVGGSCMVGAASGFCVKDPYNPAVLTCAECVPPGTSTCIGGATCVSGRCVPMHCTNNVKDLGETDADCGGAASDCLKCAAGRSCTNGVDCASGVCVIATGKCAAPTCMDNVQNQYETGADCGGSCLPCPDGLGCLVAADCQSKVCKGNTCQPPACTDGVMNGDETGVDCGGTCPPCVK